jgi:CMP/dCMP kinase
LSNISNIVIAIDGYSSTGKSTVAKGLASRLGLVYIDSGAMYRAVTLFALKNDLITGGKVQKDKLIARLADMQISFSFNSKTGISETLLNGVNVEEEIRDPEVAKVVSEVSAVSEVRKHLVHLQQQMGKDGGLVMDGRDIGTVVFPDADIKIFMTASEEVRANRRWKELQSKGIKGNIEEVRENLRHRDHIDTTRKDSPLVKADDAIELDNSNMTMDEQLNWVIDIIHQQPTANS